MTFCLLGQGIISKNQPWHTLCLGTSLRDPSTSLVRREQEIAETNCSTRNPVWGCILLHFVDFRQPGFSLGGDRQGLRWSRGREGQETPDTQSILGHISSNC